ncbi:hypothetical protein AB0K60_29300 [Thermopolyspora sp. NPDC052614]|uniref:hypothetical protein n=1 Tax=Thermopolyspora sp. NPDC052614 TaxID=3155682 RepID=UPI0034465DB1
MRGRNDLDRATVQVAWEHCVWPVRRWWRRAGGKARKRWATRWKAALNVFAVAFEGRLTPTS